MFTRNIFAKLFGLTYIIDANWNNTDYEVRRASCTMLTGGYLTIATLIIYTVIFLILSAYPGEESTLSPAE